MGSYTYIDFTVDLAVEQTVEPISGVGTVYDIAINRRGLNLFHGGDAYRDLVARRFTMPLDPERYAQGDTPFSESLNRYFYVGWSDLSGGAGQVMRDRPSSVPTRFYHSQGVNPLFVPGEVSLLPDTAQQLAGGSNRLYQASGDLYAVDVDANTVAKWDPVGGTFVDDSFPAADIIDVTSDGVDLYVATDLGIYRGQAGVYAVWSAKVVDHINWVYERIVVSSGAITANQYWSLGPDGLYDTINAVPGDDSQALPWLTLPEGWDIGDSVQGGGFVWFPARGPSSKSTVYRWKPDSGDVPQPAWELPSNELCTSVIHYQGQLLVRANIIDGGFTARSAVLDAPPTRAAPDQTVAARIYQCAIDGAGALVPFLLVSILEDDTNNGAGSFYAGGRFVGFGWSAMSDDETRSGVGLIDLATGGWCRGLLTPEADGNTVGTVVGIIEYDGDIWFSVDGQGVWRTIDARVPSGYIHTDAVDKASTLLKSVSDVRVVFDPLPYGAKVSAEVSFDRGSSWLDFGWEEGTAGAQELVERLDRQVRTFSLRTTLHRSEINTTLGPVVTIQQVQMHQSGLVDEVLELPIDCSDQTYGPSRARADHGRGTGAARARWLESLSQSDVAVQDADYPFDETIRVYQVVAVETRMLARYNEALGHNEIAQVAIVQARRPQE